MLSNFTNILFFTPLIGGVLGFAGKKAPAVVGKPLLTAASVAKLPDAPAAGFSKAVEEALGTRAAGSVQRASTPISTFAKKTLGQGVHERLGEKSVATLATSGIFAAIGTANLASGNARKIKTLKEMYSELTGKKISTLKLVLGKDLPPLLKEARREAFGGGALVSMATDLAQIGSSLYFLAAKKQPSLLTEMGIGLGLSLVPSLLTASNTALQSYEAARMSGQENIAAATYRGMIGGLAPKNTSNEAVETIAKHCFANQASTTDVLRVVNEAFYSEKRAIGAATASVAAQRSASRSMLPYQPAIF